MPRPDDLPTGWAAVDDAHPGLLAACRERALAALAEQRLTEHFDPAGDHAGALFHTIATDDPDRVTAADLLAVSTLGPALPVPLVRQVLEDPAKAERIATSLRRIPTAATITALSSDLLDAMAALDTELRRTPDATANRWVFAAKVGARKRPELFPLRDRLVCTYLAGSHDLRRSALGPFRTDVQVFASLMSDRDVRDALARHRAELGAAATGVPDLRLLDAALWLAALAHGYGTRGWR